MASLAQINIKFSADLKQFSSEMQTVLRQTEKAGREMQKVGAAMSVAITAPFVALAGVSLVNFDTQAKAIAQVEAGLKSTGEQAGFTSQELQKMASDLQETSLFGDEVILKDATAQLLTFTNIAGEQFARTQKAALDLATRLDGDLKSASIQLGKALNDPIANLSALSRSGIQFSESQKKTIAEMVKMNRLADAQTLILDELERQYGGSAEAAAAAGTGPLKQLANSWGDLTEEFGKIIAEGIAPLVKYFKDLITRLQALSPETKKTIVVVTALAAAIGPLLVVFGTILTLVPSMVAGFVAVKAAFISFTAVIAANPIGAIAVAIGLVVGALYAYSAASKEAVQTKSTLDKINEKAADNLAKERVNLERLLKVAKDETLSKTERQKAITALNKLSPEYLGNLTLESINTDKATIAVENYTQALLQKFRVEAAEAQLKELANKRFQVELSALRNKQLLIEKENKLRSNSTTLEQQGLEQLRKTIAGLEQITNNYLDQEQLLLEGILGGNKAVTEEIVAGNTELQKRNKLTAVTSTASTAPVGTISNLEAEIAKLREFQNEISTTAETWQSAQKAIEGLELQIQINQEGYASLLKVPEALTVVTDSFQVAKDRIALMNQEISDSFTSILEQGVENFAVGFGEIIGGLVAGTAGIKDIGQFLLTSIGDLVIQLGKAAIQIGVTMQAIQASFSSPLAAIAAGIALVAFGTIIKSQVPQDFQQFADGGIVGGSSYYGDKILARVNSGELILNNKQQQALYGMLDSDAAMVNVGVSDIVIDGDKLRIVMDRNATKNNRRK
jgi:hypothetical protein